MGPTDPHASITAALGRGARELAGLRLRLDRVEHELEMLFAASGHVLQPTEIGALQEIDIVVQSIDALSGFLDRLAQAGPDVETALVEAVERVPLRDLAHRLRGTDSVTAGSPGETELF